MYQAEKSKKLFEEARKFTPGGVHSQIRFFKPYPIFIESAQGSRIYDLDKNEYIDYHLAFGPIILGHSHPKITEAVKDQLTKGIIYGLSNELEVKVAKKIVQHVPSAQMVRFCNTGTEATYHAIRAARAFTGKNKIIKFEGAYHGWHDYVNISVGPSLREAGPEKSPNPVPDSRGIPKSAVENTIILPFNDLHVVEETIRKQGNEIAAVVTEPIMHGNSCCIVPKEGYLKALREICDQHNVLYIFDEVITGFRHGLGGAQKIFGVTPDITTFAKAMANGFPVASVCGKKEIMKMFSPSGKVDLGGTFNGNPISMAAVLATIRELETPGAYEHLYRLGSYARERLREVIDRLNMSAQVVGFGSIFQILFSHKEIKNYRDVLTSNSEKYERFQRELMKRQVFIIPKANKRCHLSTAHTIDDVDMTIEAMEDSLKTLSY
ncbi:MAG: glutamate-1-semialdehyde 2,1-aminomutase [Candidatus Bathyarchaeota archaeon]